MNSLQRYWYIVARWGYRTTDIFIHDELIDQRIAIHDSNHFEVKLDYAVAPKERRNAYRVETYFFIPRSFGLTSHAYTREAFFNDLQAYIRFKTPSVPLSALLDPQNDRSPMTRLARFLPELLRSPEDSRIQEQFTYELRMTGCLLRANLRDRVSLISKRMKDREDARRNNDILTACESLFNDLLPVLSRFESLRAQLVDPAVPHTVQDVYKATDEYLSLVIENLLTQLVADLDSFTQRDGTLSLRDRLVTEIQNQQRHREMNGHVQMRHSDGRPNEHYAYRLGVLKKFVMGVLFLEFDKTEDDGRAAREMTGAIAAAMAMLFATVAAILAQQSYGLNTWPFVVALVVSYVLKDRIKEWLKRIIGTRILRFVADYNTKIKDPLHHVIIGECRESVHFLEPTRVPEAIRALRYKDSTSTIEMASKRESVIRYVKDVVLNGHVIGSHHGRLNNISDILRFNISGLLVRADDPVATLDTYDAATNSVAAVPYPRVYHLNLVFVLHSLQNPNQKPIYERVRVILDKTGIKRLERA